jgi:hypothetical protein
MPDCRARGQCVHVRHNVVEECATISHNPH